MKALILLPLFALLPFLAFSNGVPEITQEEEENTIEMIENGDKESVADCTASATIKYFTPVGSITISCIATAETCEEAIEKVYKCIGALPPTEI